MSDHRIDIYEYATDLCNDIRECQENDTIHERFLDIGVFRRTGMPESFKVEFLITCGGPSVSVTVDERDCVELHHSWGMDKAGDDCHEISFDSSDTELWRELKDYFGELSEM